MIRGTVVVLHRGEVGTHLLHWIRTLPSHVALETPRGTQIAQQRNAGAAVGLQGEWVLFCDADSVPRADALPILLSRDHQIVGAAICQKQPPWALCAVADAPAPDALPSKVSLRTLPRTGTIPVVAVGTGFLLVRRGVFDAVPFPWFQCGQIRPDLLLEDTTFCLSALRRGIQPYLDCEVRVGHDFGGGVVWPGRDGRPYVEWPNGVSAPVEDLSSAPDGPGATSPSGRHENGGGWGQKVAAAAEVA